MEVTDFCSETILDKLSTADYLYPDFNLVRMTGVAQKRLRHSQSISFQLPQ